MTLLAAFLDIVGDWRAVFRSSALSSAACGRRWVRWSASDGAV